VRRLLVALSLLLAVGCGGAAKGDADAMVERPGACVGGGPMEAAEAWIAATLATDAPRDPALGMEAWQGAAVERLWREGAVWRALVAPQGAARGVVLTMSAQGAGWVISDAAPVSADVLWPGM
jgi:hypothetical protein